MKNINTTEEKIVKAAIKEFSEHGFAGARMDRIAQIAKVNKAMIYYHYKNKEKLYESILSVPAESIFSFVQDLMPDGKADLDQIYTIILRYLEFITNIDPALIRIILGEISSGGKYFKKIIIPKLIIPISTLLVENLKSEIDNKKVRNINPYYTFLQIIGSIVFSNVIRLAIDGTELSQIVFTDGYAKNFGENLIGILKHGIELKEDK